MMRWFWRLFYRLMRPRRDVSHGWILESERRQWRAGYDGVCWRWPVKR